MYNTQPRTPRQQREREKEKKTVVAAKVDPNLDIAFRYTSTYLVLLVLSGVREAGDHSRDSTGARDLARVDHDQELHQIVVDFAAAALDDVHILPANGLADFDTAMCIARGLIPAWAGVARNVLC